MEPLFFPVTQKKASQAGIGRSSDANKNALFPTQLRNLRKEKGVSQDELSKILGVSKSTVGLWETGDTLPDARSLHDLAVYYEVSADYLLGLSDVKTSDMAVRSICEYTGLTEESLDFLHGLIADRDQNGVYPAGFTDDMYSPKRLVNDLLCYRDGIVFRDMVEFCDGINNILDYIDKFDPKLTIIRDAVSRGDIYRGKGIESLTFDQLAELKIEHAKSGFLRTLDEIASLWKTAIEETLDKNQE